MSIDLTTEGPLSPTLQKVTDQTGTESALSLATDSAAVSGELSVTGPLRAGALSVGGILRAEGNLDVGVTLSVRNVEVSNSFVTTSPVFRNLTAPPDGLRTVDLVISQDGRIFRQS